jgi:hypothetical protein
MIKRQQSNTRSTGGYRLSIVQERQLEEHAKRIETQSTSRSQSGCNPSSVLALALEQPETVSRKTVSSYPFYQKLDPRTRCRESSPAPIARSHTITDLKKLWALTSNPQYPEKKESPKLAPLKRLSLGDISSSLGNIFEVLKM